MSVQKRQAVNEPPVEHGLGRTVTSGPTASETSRATLTVAFAVHFRRGERGRRRLRVGARTAAPSVELGRIPRVSRLMALAIRYDDLIRQRAVRDYAELARLGNVSRARISQIMDLLNLAPDIQEAILHLPKETVGRDQVAERGLRRVVQMPCWRDQRAAWREVITERESRSVDKQNTR